MKLPVFLRLLPVLGLSLAGLADSPFPGNTAVTTNVAVEIDPPCCRRTLNPTPPSDKSLYLLESRWTSDVGRRVSLNVFQGRIQILALFFTHCDYACPLIVRDMKRIQDALPEDARKQVDLVLVSLDSERDTPAVLHLYRKKAELGMDHWTLLTGGPDDVRELAVLLGVNYRRDAKGQFAHSNLITVLNAAGEIAHQQAGLNRPVEETVTAITRLIAHP